ncbi:MAG: hypothetical protein HRT72_13280 [Flavobacteriales bacterium]|nr:hypothetical protein [Flavobacteriales bacterium]
MLKINLKIPILFKNGDAVIVGANYNSFCVDSADTRFHFYNVTLPVGLHKIFSDKLTADFITLNRFNTDFTNVDKGHFQYGLISTFSLKKSETFKYKFGLYYNYEKFGLFLVPLIGMDWKVNKKLQILGVLPREVTVLFKAHKKLTLGALFNGQITSYAMSTENGGGYVQRSKNDLGVFVDVYLTKSMVIQVGGGYLIGTNYKTYAKGDKMDWAMSFMKFGDDRKVIDKISGDGAYFKVKLLYRFDLTNVK